MTDENKPPKWEHLRDWQWKKGQSGNPNGRPVGRTMRERLKDLVHARASDFPFAVQVAQRLNISPEDIDRMDLGDVMALAGFVSAFEGKGPQFSEIMQRLDGRVTGQFTETPSLPEGDDQRTVEDHRKEAVALYTAIIRDDNATAREKLQAQTELNRLLGLVQDESALGSPEEIAARVRDALQQMQPPPTEGSE